MSEKKQMSEKKKDMIIWILTLLVIILTAAFISLLIAYVTKTSPRFSKNVNSEQIVAQVQHHLLVA